MHRFDPRTLLCGALAAFAGAAGAGTADAFDVSPAPGATTVAAAISRQVTYAQPAQNLTTFVAFNVGSGAYLLKNKSRNTLNDVSVTFKATVTDGAERLKLFDPATFLGGLPGCSYPVAPANPLVITCTLQQMKKGATFPAFSVMYEAPAKVAGNAVGDAVDSDLVKLDVEVVYAEGKQGRNPHWNSVLSLPMPDGAAAVLGTNNPDFVRSVVPRSGSTLFSGIGGVATAQDPWTTTVVVPANFSAPTGNYTIAEIAETVTNVVTAECPSIAANLLNCSSSALSVPGTFANLVVFLRRDVSTLSTTSYHHHSHWYKKWPKPSSGIDSAKIFYTDPSRPDPRVTYPLDVPSCSDTTYGALPLPGIPCIKSRRQYTSDTAPSPEWLKDWEFEIWAIDNGRYIN